jgi:cysteine desulfurase
MPRIYLDNAATTPVRPEVVRAMLTCFTDAYGNPASIHSHGQEAGAQVSRARGQLAELIGAEDQDVIFTGGGSESDNQALKGVFEALSERGNHIITSVIEHPAILETCRFLETRGARVTYLPTDTEGLVDPEAIRRAITEKTILVSVMLANNEIGTVEPIAEISHITREAGVYLHTDAVQAVGHIPVDVDALGVDLLSLSAHKLYGPKGIGALYVRPGTRLAPLIHGGEQERGLRSGTLNVPGIVGLGEAAALASGELDVEEKRLVALRDSFIKELETGIPGCYFNGHRTRRLPGNVNVCIEHIDGEAMLVNLDLAGISVSTGSACASMGNAPSHVLAALGVPPERAHGSLRFSLGHETTATDIDRVMEVLPGIVEKLRRISPLSHN